MHMGYDEFMALAAERHSCRKFDATRKVGRDLLEKVAEAARIAPSACNRQPYRMVAVTDPATLAAVAAAYGREWIKTAPAVIVAVGLHSQAWHRSGDCMDATHIDAAIAVDHMTLAAQALGLGTCWVCAFNAMAVAQALQLAQGEEPVALLPIGWPAEPGGHSERHKVRKGINEIVQWR